MRLAIISDIHGNLEAFLAVLDDIKKQSIDSIVCLGDIVGYYPDPNRCVELVAEHAKVCVAGNHDYAAIGRIDTRTFTYYAHTAMEWTKKNITDATRDYLTALPFTQEQANMFFVHSSPANPHTWPYVFPDSEEVVFDAFNHIVFQVNFVGHTHWPFIMYQNDQNIILSPEMSIALEDANYYLVNVGSVGQPRDFDPRASYGIYDTDAKTISIVRVPYDFLITQKKILDNNLPFFLADRLEKGR